MKVPKLFRCLMIVSALAMTTTSAHATGPAHVVAGDNTRIAIDKDCAEIFFKDISALRYVLQKPKESLCASPSAAYLHSLTTPSGVVVTDIAPADHPHHRGVFFGWLDIHSAEGEGDFWGWGEYASIANRRIISSGVRPGTVTKDSASFIADNTWLAASAPLLKETLHATITFRNEARIHDLIYSFVSSNDVTISQRAFSGFAVRLRKDAPLVAEDPNGTVSRPAPSHLKPETDWPDRPWYAFEMSLPGNKKAGVAVLNHPHNPPTLWHNVTAIALLNPCIVAAGPMHITPTKTLTLRYRLVTFDGPVPRALLNQLASEWALTSGN